MPQEIRVFFIYEILGKPPEHIKDALEKFVEDFNGKDKIKLISKKVHEPKLVENEPGKDTKEDTKENTKEDTKDKKEIYTTFAEVELEVEDLNTLFAIILNTLPSNVEILEPSSLTLKNYDLSIVLSELAIKLHKYDEVAKVLALERNNLIKKLNKLTNEEPELNISTSVDSKVEDKEKIEESIKKTEVIDTKEESKEDIRVEDSNINDKPEEDIKTEDKLAEEKKEDIINDNPITDTNAKSEPAIDIKTELKENTNTEDKV